jgi:hypothetical protein
MRSLNKSDWLSVDTDDDGQLMQRLKNVDSTQVPMF